MNKHNKTETEIQTQRTTGGCQMGKWEGGGNKQVKEIKMYKLPDAKQMSQSMKCTVWGRQLVPI